MERPRPSLRRETSAPPGSASTVGVVNIARLSIMSGRVRIARIIFGRPFAVVIVVTFAAIGYAAPAIPASVEFLNANFKDMKDLRGKVVVIEAFTSKSVGGLVAVVKAQAAVTETKLGADDIIIIASIKLKISPSGAT